MMAAASTSLWMGDNLDPYMDESFISMAFKQMGVAVKGIKVIKSKTTGLPAGYCFIDFHDPENAHQAMLKLNGKNIPNSSPTRRFKLNSASYGKEHLSTPEYSLFVGDLTEEVDDYTLYQAFSRRFKSCRSAKVVLEPSGKSKGYGFVRFTEETDQQRALIEMQHMQGVGKKPIRVSLATPKRPMAQDPNSTYYGNYYGQNYYNNQYYNYYGYNAYNQYYDPYSNYNNYYETQQDEDMEALEEPEVEVDVFRYNKDYMEQSEEIFDVLELSRWTPLDSVNSKLPTVKLV
nr:tRNA selenocysteine 1-associated protein 1 isoform X1 [Crassostrea gigas]